MSEKTDDPILLAYLAGIIDGEGCVGYHSRGTDLTNRFVIQVSMTYRPIVDLLADSLGGTVIEKKPGKKHYKRQWRWRVTDAKARVVYQKLLPFLRLKTFPNKDS